MATTTIKTTFQLKRGTAQRWIEVNPILKQGEPGFEYDTNKLKVGDGITPWVELPYITQDTEHDVISKETFNALPEIGDVSKIYKINSEKMLYQWSSEKSAYEPLGSGGSFDPTTITLINGGKAND